MLTAAAVCPHPPLLVPGATGGAAGPGDDELERLRTACAAAVTALAEAAPDIIVVVGGGQRTGRFPAHAAGTLTGFGVPFTIGEGTPVLPLSLTIGRYLLAGGPRAELQGVAADASPGECLDLGETLAAMAPSVAILAMGDGPARRARQAPDALDPESGRYDEHVCAALAAADAGAIASLDPSLDAKLSIAGRAAWQVLAGAAGTGEFAGHLHYCAAPFEVSYYTATWRSRAQTDGG
jgi:hypothetical protein